MNQEAARKDWNERGFSFGIFRDPPGQVWADFVHRTDELVMLAEGEIELEIEGKTQRPLIGLPTELPTHGRVIYFPAMGVIVNEILAFTPGFPAIRSACLQFPEMPGLQENFFYGSSRGFRYRRLP